MVDVRTARVRIKRRFAEWREDAIEVPAPTDEELADYDGDLIAWASDRYDSLYERAINPNDDTYELLWEDEWQASVESFDDEFHVREVG